VSALWAVSDPAERDQIEQAHTQAVASTIESVERQVELVRGRVDGEYAMSAPGACSTGRR
jgi:hypothetical protein